MREEKEFLDEIAGRLARENILTCAVQSVRYFSSVNHTEHYTTKKENRKKRTMDEEDKKQKVCRTMAELISGIFAGWELQFNAPGYGTNYTGLEQGLFSVQVYRKLQKYKKLVVFRLVPPDAPPEKALAEIAEAFLFAVKKMKEVEGKS